VIYRIVLIALALSISTLVLAGPKIQHWKTKNGARVYFVPAPELPMVDIRVVFEAGSSRDGGKPGLALLTNALLSEGTKNMNADQIAELFDGLGAQLSNDSLRDMASVELRSLSDAVKLNKAVDAMAEIIRRPAFRKQAFQRERDRLLVALKAQAESPGKIAEQAFYQAVFGNHPYHTMPTGNEASVKKLTPKMLRQFHDQYYVGNNAVIALVGALHRKSARALAERLIGKLPKGKRAKRLPRVADLGQARRKEIAHPSTQTHILVGQPGITRKDPDYYALYVGNHILGGSGLVSRISDEIREKRGLAYSSYSYFLPMARRGPFQMGLQTRNDQAEQALRILLKTLQQFIDQGPTAEELKSAKKNISGGFALRLNSNRKIATYLSIIGFYELPLDYLDSFVNKVQAVTVADVKKAFAKRVFPAHLATVIVGGSQHARAD